MSNQRRLVVMANQIGQFFASSQGPEQGVVATAEHLRKFWEPRMRRAGVALLEHGGEGLQPVPRQALQLLAAQQTTPDATVVERFQETTPLQAAAS